MQLPATVLRTLTTVVHDQPFAWASAAVGLQAKNVKHSSYYFMRTVHAAFDARGAWKPKATADQKQTVAEINAMIRTINAEHRAANQVIAEENKEIRRQNKEVRRQNQLTKRNLRKGETFVPVEAIKEVPLKKIYREFGARRNPAKPASIVDRALLDRLVRAHPDPDGFHAYKALPATVAQQTINESAEAFHGYYEAGRLYRKEPEKFTGRPKWPDYGDKHQPIPFTFTAQSLKKKRKGPDGKTVNEYRFISLNGKEIHVDYEKTTCLKPSVMQAFADFPLDRTLKEMRERTKLPDAAKLCEVRVIPLPGDETEIEAIFEVPVQVPAESLAAKMYGQLDQGLKPSQINEALVRLLRDTPADRLPRIAGIDPGLNNFLTLAFSFSERAMVLSNKAIERELEDFDLRYDALKSTHTSEELSDLLVRNMTTHDLSKAEVNRMRKLLKELHAKAEIVTLLRDRAHWRDAMVHKVSAGIVDYLQKRRVQVLVIGLNPFWKLGSDMGRKQNRRSYRAAHTKLIELLKYKCLQVGILVVTTEESFTSKTSFALDEVLQVFDETKAWNDAFEQDEVEEDNAGEQQTPPSGDAPTAGETPPAAPEGKVVLRGWRDQKKRNYFHTPGAPAGWQEMHADVNGALNIIRKIFRHFHWHAGLTPKFWIYRFSQTANLTKMRLAA